MYDSVKCWLVWSSLKKHHIDSTTACKEFPSNMDGLAFLNERCVHGEKMRVHHFLIKMMDTNFVEGFVYQCLLAERCYVKLGATRGLQKCELRLRERRGLHSALRTNARHALKQVIERPRSLDLRDVRTYIKTLKYLGMPPDIDLIGQVSLSLRGFYKEEELVIIKEKIQLAESCLSERLRLNVK